MCLSEVYKQTENEPVFLLKNIAKILPQGEELIFYDLMGRKTAIKGSIIRIDLMENTVLIKENEK